MNEAVSQWREAIDIGLGVLNFSNMNEKDFMDAVQIYRQAIINSGKQTWQTNNYFAAFAQTLVLDDDKKACEYGGRGHKFFEEAKKTYYYTKERHIGPITVDRNFLTPDELKLFMDTRISPDRYMNLVMGDPSAAKESISRFKNANVDELILFMQLGTIPHELIMESLKIFAEKVMPFFA